MRAIMIGPEEEAALEALVAHAEAHPVTTAQILRQQQGKLKPIGEDPRHRLELPGGLRLVLSLEDQPAGLMRHVSISVFPRRAGALPNPAMVNVILPLLGFKRPVEESAKVWVEGGVAINILQLEAAPA